MITALPPVKCPKCGRYLGAYIGRAQCKSCNRWVDVLDKEKGSEAQSP